MTIDLSRAFPGREFVEGADLSFVDTAEAQRLIHYFFGFDTFNEADRGGLDEDEAKIFDHMIDIGAIRVNGNPENKYELAQPFLNALTVRNQGRQVSTTPETSPA